MKSLGLLILRRAVGLGLAWHGGGKVCEGGSAKMTAMVTDWGWPLPGIFATSAGVIELAGGLLLALGLYTRYAAVPAAAVMMVALIKVHPGNPYESGGELALVYLAGCVTLLLTGAGRWSVDGAE